MMYGIFDLWNGYFIVFKWFDHPTFLRLFVATLPRFKCACVVNVTTWAVAIVIKVCSGARLCNIAYPANSIEIPIGEIDFR